MRPDGNGGNDATMSRAEALQEMLDRVGRAKSEVANGEKNEEAGRLLNKVRAMLGMSYRQSAEELGVSTASIRRWEGEGIPNDKVRWLEKLLKRKFDEEATRSESLKRKWGLCYIDDRRVAIRSIEYIRRREEDALIVWVLRSNTAFLSGYPGEFRDFMIDQLLRSKGMLRGKERKMEYRFLYCETKDECEERLQQQENLKLVLNPDPTLDGEVFLKPENKVSANKARDSHALFKKACLAVQERKVAEGNREIDIFNRAQAWPVKDMREQMILGVGVLFISMVLMEYSDEAVEDLGREYDVFVEIPAAVVDEEHSDRLQIGAVKAWAQLAPHKAQSVLMAWRPVLNKCMREDPFLNSHDEARAYIVPALE